MKSTGSIEDPQAAAVVKDRNYPIAPTAGPARINLGTYVAVFLEELGFPPVRGGDQARLDAALNHFLYEQPKAVTR